MLRATKQEAKKLKELAKGLPVTTYPVPKYDNIMLDGKLVYARVGYDLHKVNHEKRIVDAYNRGGMDLVKEYIRGVMQLDDIATTKINIQPRFYVTF